MNTIRKWKIAVENCGLSWSSEVCLKRLMNKSLFEPVLYPATSKVHPMLTTSYSCRWYSGVQVFFQCFYFYVDIGFCAHKMPHFPIWGLDGDTSNFIIHLGKNILLRFLSCAQVLHQNAWKMCKKLQFKTNNLNFFSNFNSGMMVFGQLWDWFFCIVSSILLIGAHNLFHVLRFLSFAWELR